MHYKTLAFALGILAAFALTACSDGSLGATDENNAIDPRNELLEGTLSTIYDDESGFEPSVFPIEMKSQLILQNGDDFSLSATSSKTGASATVSLQGNQLHSSENGQMTSMKVRPDELDLLSTLKKRSEELKEKVEKLKPLTAQEWKKKLMSYKGAVVNELPSGNLETSRSFVNKNGQTVVNKLIIDGKSRIPISMETYLDGDLVAESKVKNGKVDHSYHYDGRDSVRPQKLAPWK